LYHGLNCTLHNIIIIIIDSSVTAV